MDPIWGKVIRLNLKWARERFAAKKSWWWHFWRKPEKIESEYRQFLFLMASNPEKNLIPWSQDLDDFWLQHSLDIKKYAADCHSIAHRPLPYNHHLRGEFPSQTRWREETRKLYLATFGETARRHRRADGESWTGADDVQVFSESHSHAHGSHHAHHGGGHHADAGAHADHGGHPGHSCGGHGGHGCGGHGCGGHGCGGHGCGGH